MGSIVNLRCTGWLPLGADDDKARNLVETALLEEMTQTEMQTHSQLQCWTREHFACKKYFSYREHIYKLNVHGGFHLEAQDLADIRTSAPPAANV